MGIFLLGLVVGFNLAWVFMSFRRDAYWGEFRSRCRGGSPPPNRKPAVPEQPLAAQLIRYQLWKDEQVRQAFTDPRFGEPWPEDCQPDRQAEALRDAPIRLDEGKVQRGGFGGGPTTPKPPIKPQSTRGRQLP